MRRIISTSSPLFPCSFSILIIPSYGHRHRFGARKKKIGASSPPKKKIPPSIRLTELHTCQT